MNTGLQEIKFKVDNRRALAILVVATGRNRFGHTVTPEDRQEANEIERRCAVAVRRLNRLQRLHERHEGDIAYLDIPKPFKLEDVEHALGVVKAFSEDDPGALDDGTSRHIPLLGEKPQ